MCNAMLKKKTEAHREKINLKIERLIKKVESHTIAQPRKNAA